MLLVGSAITFVAGIVMIGFKLSQRQPDILDSFASMMRDRPGDVALATLADGETVQRLRSERSYSWGLHTFEVYLLILRWE